MLFDRVELGGVNRVCLRRGLAAGDLLDRGGRPERGGDILKGDDYEQSWANLVPVLPHAAADLPKAALRSRRLSGGLWRKTQADVCSPKSHFWENS